MAYNIKLVVPILHSKMVELNESINMKHLLNVARALKFQSHLPNSFRGDFIMTAAHLVNLLPTKLLNYKTPFEVLYNKIPHYKHLKVFGCLCYATNVTASPNKLGSRALMGIFIPLATLMQKKAIES